MSHAPRMRPDPRPARTRAAILKAARQLIGEQGEEATSIASIAQLAGTSVGSIYGHFGSKDVLTLAMVDEALAPYLDRFDAAEEPADALEAILAMGDFVVEAALAEPVAVRALLARSLAPPAADTGQPQVEPQILQRLGALERRLVANLGTAIDDGTVARAPIDDLVAMLIGLWTGIAGQTVRRDERRTADETTRHAIALSRQLLSAGLPALAA